MQSKGTDPCSGRGHFEMVQRLFHNRREFVARNFPALRRCVSTSAINLAAASGHLGIVKFLHEHQGGNCTTKAMDLAAANGHLQVVQWLHENCTKGCTVDAIDEAASNGHFYVVRWLIQNRDDGFTSIGINQAAAKGHQELLDLLASSRPDLKLSESTAQKAMNQNHFDIIEWFLKHDLSLVSDRISSMRLQHHDQLLSSYTDEYDLIEPEPTESDELDDKVEIEEETEDKEDDYAENDLEADDEEPALVIVPFDP